MFMYHELKFQVWLLSLCLLLTSVSLSHGANLPHGNKSPPPANSPAASSGIPSKQSRSGAARTDIKTAVGAKNSQYTIKAGDTLFKILMREYGLTGRQAEKFIEIIRRENKISNFRRLQIGQRITISSVRQKSPTGPSNIPRKTAVRQTETPKPLEQIPDQTQVLALERQPLPVMQPSVMTSKVKQVWGDIIPEQRDFKKTLSVTSDNIYISLDPVKYPILTAMDGGRILVDVDGKMSPSIKSIIAKTDPGLRVISESAEEPRRFLTSLIGAGKFYSVAEDFVMEFGSDPKLTIRSDFRVERTPESLINHDVILLNAGKVALSSNLTRFLKNEGFTVYEPFALTKPHTFTPRNRLIQVTSNAPLDIASSLLRALSITAEENARIEIPDVDNSGISISVTPDRYFRYKGKSYCVRYAVKNTDADSSLTPILAARGINSIVINPNDDLRKISESILTSVGLVGSYGFHKLWPEEGAGYSLQMSGIMIDGAGASGESLFITNREIDRIIRDISVENGFIVENR